MKHVLSVTSILCVMLFTFPTLAGGAHGVFRVVKGSVKVKSAQSGQEARARLGSKVLPGDVVITEKDSRAKIVMVDNNEINVSPDSQIKIEKYEFDPAAGKKEVLLNVIYGKVRSKVEQKYDGKTSKFQVKTPSAVAGVRGTDFIAGFQPSTRTSQVITFEGRVEFGLPGPGGTIINPVSVVPGQMAEIGTGGKPAQPTEVPKGDLDQMNKESNADTASVDKGPAPTASTDANPEGDKKSEGDKKAEGAKAEGDGKADTAKSDGAKSSGDRKPSSASSTLKSGDLPSTNPQAFTPPVMPAAPIMIQPKESDIVNRIKEGGSTLLKIKVNTQ